MRVTSAWTLLAAAFFLAAAPLAAQAARLAIAPARPDPGALVTITVTDSAGASDSIVALRGTMAGEPLHFGRAKGAFRAIGAVPVDSGATPSTAEVLVERTSGRVDTLRAAVEPPPMPPPSEKLSVTGRYGEPFDSATNARVELESARAREIGRRSHDVPPLWTTPFQSPRATPITSRFGTGRTFNGKVTSRHLGVDLKGATGDPVLAANRGVVALVDTTVLGGRVVYVDHGGGIVTAYMHLSKPLVAAGDTVRKGQRIGLVGATGRVTGPHLHWGARYGALTVNPLGLLALAPLAPLPAPPIRLAATVDSIAWLAGCLQAGDTGLVVEEQRMAPRAGTMLGMGRTTAGTKLGEYEWTLITRRGGALVYEAHPSGQAVATFTATVANADSVIFEDLAHDFPQRVGYRRLGADSVIAWVAGRGAGAGGAEKRVEFRYARVACPR